LGLSCKEQDGDSKVFTKYGGKGKPSFEPLILAVLLRCIPIQSELFNFYFGHLKMYLLCGGTSQVFIEDVFKRPKARLTFKGENQSQLLPTIPYSTKRWRGKTLANLADCH